MVSEEKKRKLWLYVGKIPPEHSGAGNRCVKHAIWFASQDYDVSIVTTTMNPDPIEGVKTISLRTYRTFKIVTQYINLVAKYYGLKKEIKKHGKPYIIHVFGAGISSYPITKICEKYGINSIIEAVVTLPENTFTYRLKPNKYIRKFGLNKADKLIAISEGVKCSIFSHGVDREIKIVPNVVNIERFSENSTVTKKDLREELKLPVDSILILMIGLVCLRKGHDVALKVLHNLKIYSDVRLVAVGPYNKKSINKVLNNCTTKEKALFNSEKVILTGMRYDVKNYYNACDLYLFPSRKEGFGNVLIEAMASKIPIIASELDGITNTIIEHEKTGYLVSDNRVDDYVRYCLELIMNSERKKEITENARESVKKRYSEDVIYREYDDFYKGIS